MGTVPGLLAVWTQAIKGHMDTVDLVAGAGLELFIQCLQSRMVDLLSLAAYPADQVMVVVLRDLIDRLAVAVVTCQHQALIRKEAQRPVNGSLGQSGYYLLRLPENFNRQKMPACIPQDAQDCQPLWGQAITQGT